MSNIKQDNQSMNDIIDLRDGRRYSRADYEKAMTKTSRCRRKTKNCCGKKPFVGCRYRYKKSDYELTQCPQCGKPRDCEVRSAPTRACRVHGGTAKSGYQHHSTKTGKHSRVLKQMPARMRDAFMGNLDDAPNHASFDEEVALLDTRRGELLERIADEDTAGARWEAAQRAFASFQRASRRRDATAMGRHLDALEAALTEGGDYSLWNEINALTEQRRKIVDTAAKIEYQKQTVLSAPDATLFAAYLIRSVLHAIDKMDASDSSKLDAKQEIQNDFMRIMVQTEIPAIED